MTTCVIIHIYLHVIYRVLHTGFLSKWCGGASVGMESIPCKDENLVVRISDVAKLAGVSTATVSRTINDSGYVSQDTRIRVLEAMDELGYTPPGGRRTFLQTSLFIALVIPDVTNPFFPAVVRGVDDSIKHQGYQLVLCNADDGAEQELALVKMLVEKRVDGLIYTPARDGKAVLDLARRYGIPIVLLDRVIEDSSVDCIATDHHAGAYKAVQHLLDLGHRRIAHIAGPKDVPSASERHLGYLAALQDNQVADDSALVIQGDYTQHTGGWALEQLMALETPPTAVLASNDLNAVGLMARATECGVRIPRDLSVCGFDDIEHSTIVSPKLTTVSQDKYGLGKLAAEYLLRRIREPLAAPRHIRLTPELVVRESTTVSSRV